jgi:hypothetical protein
VEFSTSPDFAIGPASLALGPGDIATYDLRLTGTFAPDGSSLGRIALTGLLDLRDPTTGDAAFCEVAAAEGEPCEACPDGSPSCFALDVSGLEGRRIDDPVVAIDAADCEGCESGPPADDATCATDTGA